jgi:hypothetical protein
VGADVVGSADGSKLGDALGVPLGSSLGEEVGEMVGLDVVGSYLIPIKDLELSNVVLEHV